MLVRDCEVGGPTADMTAARHRRSDSGISWESVDGATVENIVATRIKVLRAKSPLFLRLGDRGRKRPEQDRPPVGQLRRIVFDRITGYDTGPRGSYFIGMPDHRITDVALRDISFTSDATADSIVDETTIAEMPANYPDALMIPADTPARGLWTRHIENLTLQNFAITTSAPDPRPLVHAVTDAENVCGG